MKVYQQLLSSHHGLMAILYAGPQGSGKTHKMLNNIASHKITSDQIRNRLAELDYNQEWTHAIIALIMCHLIKRGATSLTCDVSWHSKKHLYLFAFLTGIYDVKVEDLRESCTPQLCLAQIIEASKENIARDKVSTPSWYTTRGVHGAYGGDSMVMLRKSLQIFKSRGWVDCCNLTLTLISRCEHEGQGFPIGLAVRVRNFAEHAGSFWNADGSHIPFGF